MVEHPLNTWLPPSVRAAAAATEPRRFARVASELELAWKEGRGRPGGGGTLRWVSVVNSFLDAKSDVDVADVESVVRVAIDVVVVYDGELFTQIRWMNCAARLLRKFRYRLQNTSIPWEPFFTRLVSMHLDLDGCCKDGCRGAAIRQIHAGALTSFVRKARRFFPPGSAAQIWNRVRPMFVDLAHNRALLGVGLLDLFLPTVTSAPPSSSHPGASAPEGQWSMWVSEWVQLWCRVAHCNFWDVHWLALLARCAKHLPQSVRSNGAAATAAAALGSETEAASSSAAEVYWSPEMIAAIYQRALNGLGLPVGQSPGATSAPVARQAPDPCMRVFHSPQFGRSSRSSWGSGSSGGSLLRQRAVRGGKLIVWLLPLQQKSPPEDVVPSAATSAAAGGDVEKQMDASSSSKRSNSSGNGGGSLEQLRTLVEVVEQFYHPSNGGEWTTALEGLLHGLCSTLVKMLRYRQNVPSHGSASVNTNAQRLGTSTAVDAAALIARRLLHQRALFSKSTALAAEASKAAAALAYIAPLAVLPIVLDMFESAVTTDTATHQLETSLTTLARAARPLLLSIAVAESAAATANPLSVFAAAAAMDIDNGPATGGFSFSAAPADGEGSSTDPAAAATLLAERGRLLLSEAMFVALPGIDANDPPKTLATFHFFLAVFSSSSGPLLAPNSEGSLGKESVGLEPIFSLESFDWPRWLEEFLSRLFVLFSHLEEETDTAKHHHGGSISFLLTESEGSVMRPFLELLFSRLPSQGLLDQAVSSVARFMRTNVLPAAGLELGTFCASLACAAPSAVCAAIVPHTCAAVADLLKGSGRTGFSALANTAESAGAVEAAGGLESNVAGAGAGAHALFRRKLPGKLSAAAEDAVVFHLKVLSYCTGFVGPSLLPHREVLLATLDAAFDAPSHKVNEVAGSLLQGLLMSLLLYYPTNEHRFMGVAEEAAPAVAAPSPSTGLLVEEWVAARGPLAAADPSAATATAEQQLKQQQQSTNAPAWHEASLTEVEFAEELVARHVSGVLADISFLCSCKEASAWPEEKDAWRVVLLRLCRALSGLRTLLPDFPPDRRGGTPAEATGDSVVMEEVEGEDEGEPLAVVGSSGVSVGTAVLRQEVARAAHDAFEHLLQTRPDDVSNISLLAEVMDHAANYGSSEYNDALHFNRVISSHASMLSQPLPLLTAQAAIATAPATSSLWAQQGAAASSSELVPGWLFTEKAYKHVLWRASQASFRRLGDEQNSTNGGSMRRNGPPRPPAPVAILLNDLLRLCTYRYRAAQAAARPPLERILKRFPGAVDGVLFELTDLLVAGGKGKGGPADGGNGGGGSSGSSDGGSVSSMTMSSEAKELVAVGVCSLLPSRPFMRRLTQNNEAMASFMSALHASVRLYDTPKGQEAITEAFISFAVRYEGRPFPFVRTNNKDGSSANDNGPKDSSSDGRKDCGRPALDDLVARWLPSQPSLASLQQDDHQQKQQQQRLPIAAAAAVAALGVQAGAGAEDVAKLVKEADRADLAAAVAAAVASGGSVAKKVEQHWRLSFMTDSFLLFLQQPPSSSTLVSSLGSSAREDGGAVLGAAVDQAAALAEHFLLGVLGPLPPLRALATAGLATLLQSRDVLQTAAAAAAVRRIIQASTGSSNTTDLPTTTATASAIPIPTPTTASTGTTPATAEPFGSLLLANLAVDHITAAAGGRGGGYFQSGALASLPYAMRGVVATIAPVAFPSTKWVSVIAPPFPPGFNSLNARLAELLTSHTGTDFIEAVRLPLQQAVLAAGNSSGRNEGGNGNGDGGGGKFDLGMAVTVAEIVGGILRSSHPAVLAALEGDTAAPQAGSGGGASKGWLSEVLRHALLKQQDSTADATDEWLAGLRYTLSSSTFGFQHSSTTAAPGISSSSGGSSAPSTTTAEVDKQVDSGGTDGSTGSSRPGEDRARARTRACIHAILLEPLPSSSPAALVTKRLHALCVAVGELGLTSANDADVRFLSGVASELQQSLAMPARQVREAVGQLLCLSIGRALALCATFSAEEANSPPGAAAAVAAVAEGLAMLVTSSAQSAAEALLLQHAHTAVSTGLHVAAEAAPSGAAGDADMEDFSQSRGSAAQAAGSDTGTHVHSLETALYFLTAAIKTGEGSLFPHIIQTLLPTILCTQEAAGAAGDDDLSLLGKQALAYMKLHPLLPQQPGQAALAEVAGDSATASAAAAQEADSVAAAAITSAIVNACSLLPSSTAAAGADTAVEKAGRAAAVAAEAAPADAVTTAEQRAMWRQRAAGFAFVQAFMFRHLFLLPPTQLSGLQHMALAGLRDPQPEVRELASATLAGLMKSAPAAAGAAGAIAAAAWSVRVRSSLSTTAESVIRTHSKTKKKTKVVAAGATRTTTHSEGDAQEAVMGLSAVVRTAPYDVPRWMPDAVMLLVRLASLLPPPLGPTAAKAVAEFRRTHADTWHVHKHAFTDDQLEMMTGLLPASGYFV